MKCKQGLLVICILLVAVLITTTCFASAVKVDFEKQTGLPITTSSVTVIKAKSVSEDGDLRIVGQLKRPHRLPMTGHLHAYAYNENGELVSDYKKQVLNLNSQRRGSMRLPFRISIKDIADEIDRVYLEYHSSGQSET